MSATVMAGVGFWREHEVHLGIDTGARKKRHDFPLCKAHSSESLPKQAKCCNSRRELLAFGICTSETVFSGTFMKSERYRADAAQESSMNSKLTESSDSKKQADEGGALDSPVSALLSLFDPNEKTKSGKLLPKNYIKSARNVVKSLKESLKEESSKETDVRKSADQAKEAIRDYMLNWRGQKAVQSEDSYKALEGVIKILGNFYAKQGPRAVLPTDVKSEIMRNLEVADADL